MPSDVVLGDDGVFGFGGDDASSIDEKRPKRVVSAVPGAPGQVYGGTQVGNLCRGPGRQSRDLLGGRAARRPQALPGWLASPRGTEQSCSTYSSARVKQTTKATGQP